MAVYQFSALSDGQAISFDPSADRLNFDQTTIAAGDLHITPESGGNLRVTVKSGPAAGKDIVLLETDLAQIAATNLSFADGSFARVGDNAVGTSGDNANNALAGGTGRDLLMGLGGNDTLSAGDNNDSLVGGGGNDAVNGNGGNDWLDGSEGNDVLTGSSGQDTFVFGVFGAANADSLPDFASNWDRIELDSAGFFAIGATGRFAAGDARFFAGTAAHDADDRIIFNSATGQIFYDADGNGAGFPAQLIATLGAGRGVVATDFTVTGTAAGGGNAVDGTAGDDTMIGTAGNDTLNGLGGNDSITGGFGLDSLTGGDGNDTLDGSSFEQGETGEADTLVGGAGDDLYIVGANDVTVDSGGIDSVEAWDTSWTLAAGLENLRLRPTGRSDGQSGTGNDLNNVIDPSGLEHGGTYHGLGGNDTILSAQRDGTYFGDDGDDLLDGRFNNGNQLLFGGNGNDTLIPAGNGGQMTGGAGADSFVYLNAGNGGLVTDFASGSDKIHLDASSMTALGATGNFAAGDARFFAGAGATSGHDADDRVVYDTSTGAFYYDADGNGAGLGILIGTLQGAPAFAATDIVVDNGTPSGTTINGTAGDDSLVGTPGDDSINGLGGNDTIDGREGADTFDGGLGDDVYIVGEGDVIVADAGGIDTVVAVNTAEWTLGAGLENLDIDDSGFEDFGPSGTGNELGNIIRGGSNGGTLSGLGGDDLLIGRNDIGSVTWLFGGDGNDTLRGASGATEMDGGAGDDVLVGAGGNEVAVGGAGADSFVFEGSFHAISDFASGTDKLRFDGTVFTDIGASGNFAAGDARFFAGSAAHDADDRIIFDAASGDLWYDADGNGAQDASLVAQFLSNVVATDIAVDNGAPSGQTINGTNGNDTLVGGAGDDMVNGLGGNDLLIGMQGSDSLAGGDGNDLVDAIAGSENPFRDFPGERNTLSGGAGDDVFIAWASDVLQDAGGFSRLVIAADGGYTMPEGFDNLRIAFNTLADEHFSITGNSSSNVIVPVNFRNTIDAGDGNDRIYGGDDRDFIDGGAGDDWLHGGEGIHDQLTGGAGADHFVIDTALNDFDETIFVDFTSGVDKIHLDLRFMPGLGATGNFAAGDARFNAGPGFRSGQDSSDRVVYDTSSGILSTAGGTLIAFLTGAPALTATDIVVENGGIPGAVLYGTNQAFGSGGVDEIINGTQYNDTMIGLAGNDAMDGRMGNDLMDGGAGNDTMVGREGNDTMLGAEGDDTFDLPWTFPIANSSGADAIDGGSGTDLLRFSFNDTATIGVTVNLAAGTASGGAPGSSATLTSIENVAGTQLADSLSGSAGANSLVGAGGNDTLNGGAGNDTLDGGFGTGGDTYAFTSTGTANADLVVSFETGNDTVQLDGAVMTALGASGRFTAGDVRFYTAPGASSGHDADDRVIFNQATFELFYDPDGSGSAAAQLLAQFTGNAPQASDIVVVNGSSGGGAGQTIIGTSGNDSLAGTTGNDSINGGSGNDSLAGAGGNDTLTGSGGQDTFIFREFGAANADRMTDFATSWDRLQVDDSAFTEAGAAGRLASGDARFFAGVAAHDADDRFVFNAGTGQLYYDADGNGSDAAQLVATVQAGAGIAATDITVI